MADSKITALAALTTADPANDMFPVVDVSDTSMAASGTTKRISINNILACSPSATLASATITGAATVGTTLGVTGASTLASVGVTGAATVGTTLLVGTNATLTNGNVIIGTSGKGIDFSAVTGGTGTATGNVLNDYEEGTFTPTVAGSTDAGSASYTRSGYYTKVGRLVTITVYMNWTAHTGTGNMRFGGLPFTSANVATNYNGISIGYVNNIALTAGNVLYGLLEFGTTYVTATQSPTGGGAYSLVPIDTSAEIAFTATYFV